MLDDGPGLYPMPMLDGPLAGPPENRPPAEAGHASAATQPAQESSPYQLLPPATQSRGPDQEPLRALPAPPPIVSGDGGPPGMPAMRPPHHPSHHGHAPSQQPQHHRGGGRRGMRGLGDDTPQSASNLLGLALVAVPVGGYVGGRYAGALGILGGMLAAGGFVNGVRAARALTSPPADSSETWVSATFAVLGLGAAAYLLYRGHGSKHARPNSSKTELAENKRRL